jgi:antitoxin VapB
METVRHVRLFRNGRSQAVRIPKDFELEGSEAIIRKEGDRLIIEPIDGKNRLIELLKKLSPIEEELYDLEDAPLPAEEIF